MGKGTDLKRDMKEAGTICFVRVEAAVLTTASESVEMALSVLQENRLFPAGERSGVETVFSSVEVGLGELAAIIGEEEGGVRMRGNYRSLSQGGGLNTRGR